MTGRVSAAALTILLAGLALDKVCLDPYVCNLRLSSLRKATERAFADADGQRAAIVARTLLVQIADCRPAFEQRSARAMLTAANERILGRLEEALRSYEFALDSDRRPELFLNAGLVLSQLNEHERARDNLAAAGFFDPNMIAAIDDPRYRDEVLIIVSNPEKSGRPILIKIMDLLRKGSRL